MYRVKINIAIIIGDFKTGNFMNCAGVTEGSAGVESPLIYTQHTNYTTYTY